MQLSVPPLIEPDVPGSERARVCRRLAAVGEAAADWPVAGGAARRSPCPAVLRFTPRRVSSAVGGGMQFSVPPLVKPGAPGSGRARMRRRPAAVGEAAADWPVAGGAARRPAFAVWAAPPLTGVACVSGALIGVACVSGALISHP